MNRRFATSALSLVPHEPEQVPRLRQFREDYPDVTVYAGAGYWQAVIPSGVILGDASTQVFTRQFLRDMLDTLYGVLESP